MFKASSPACVHRLGMHHFAHLRAVASGLSIQESALHYLGVETVHQAKLAHYQTIDAVKNVARRRSFKTWRLVGLSIPVAKNKATAAPKASLPTLEEFIAARDLDGWSEQEVLEMYKDEYGSYSAQTSPEIKFEEIKLLRREKLRAAQFELLSELEHLAAEKAQLQDHVSGWLEANLADKLIAEGIVTLQQLSDAINQCVTWYTKIAGVGKNKALRIEKHLDLLIAPQTKETFSLITASLSVSPTTSTIDTHSANVQGLSDSELFEIWLMAKAQTPATKKSYRRESLRFLLWLQIEKNNLRLQDFSEKDCIQYIAFLKNIPAHWIAKRNVAPMQTGWLPFRGQLTAASYAQAIAVLSSAFHWLFAERYLATNPWIISSKKLNGHTHADTFDASHNLSITLNSTRTNSFTEKDWVQILAFIHSQPPSPSKDRIEFILKFTLATGLSSSELIGLKLSDIQVQTNTLTLKITLAGKERLLLLTDSASKALTTYLIQKNISISNLVTSSTPVLSSLADPSLPIGYQALYEHVKSWINRAIEPRPMPEENRMRLKKASMKWLKNGFTLD